MVMERSHGQMVLSMKVNTLMERNTGMDFSNGLMDLNIKDIL